MGLQKDKSQIKNNMEDVRFLNIPIEMKALTQNDEFFQIEGFASTFNNKDLGNDIIMQGAFTKTLQNRKPKLLYQHEIDQPIGVIDEATENEVGLMIKARMPKDVTLAKEIFSLMSIGALDSFSIGFSVKDFEILQDETRVIKEVELFEISIVTIPMNPQARIVGFKSVEDVGDIETRRDFEVFLKQHGFSKKAAVRLANKFGPEAGAESLQNQNNDKELENAFHVLKKTLTNFVKENK